MNFKERGNEFYEGEEVSFEIQGLDLSVVKAVRFRLNDGIEYKVIQADFTAPYSANLQNYTEGEYRIWAKAKTDSGEVFVSSYAQIIILC